MCTSSFIFMNRCVTVNSLNIDNVDVVIHIHVESLEDYNYYNYNASGQIYLKHSHKSDTCVVYE